MPDPSRFRTSMTRLGGLLQDLIFYGVLRITSNHTWSHTLGGQGFDALAENNRSPPVRAPALTQSGSWRILTTLIPVRHFATDRLS